jgi:hypothetical protein
MAGGTPRSAPSRAKTPEPEAAPTTPSGVSPRPVEEIELTVLETPSLEVEEAPPPPLPPEQPPAPEKLPRLNERLSTIHIHNAVNDGYPSHAIALVQGALTGAGHDPGPYDGVGGRRTRAALAEFAAARGIELTDLDSLAETLDALGFDV